MENNIYFVSYAYSKGNGMIKITLDRPIETYDEVLAIKEYLDKKLNDDTVILNWIPLKN